MDSICFNSKITSGQKAILDPVRVQTYERAGRSQNHQKWPKERFLYDKYILNLLKNGPNPKKIHWVGQKIKKFKKFEVSKKWEKTLVIGNQRLKTKLKQVNNFPGLPRICTFRIYNQFLWENSRSGAVWAQSWYTHF